MNPICCVKSWFRSPWQIPRERWRDQSLFSGSFIQQKERNLPKGTALCKTTGGLGAGYILPGVVRLLWRRQSTVFRKPRGCRCVLKLLSQDSVGEVSCIPRLLCLLSKPMLAPHPEPAHAMELGHLAGISYLQIAIAGTGKNPSLD